MAHGSRLSLLPQIDAHIQKKLFKASTLYGASREMLMRENRLLRSQLEEHLVTSRTSRLAGASSFGRVAAPESKLKQARMMLGPHMESVAQLREAAEALDAAERSFKLPSVRHAEVQADDGSVKTIQTLEKQLGVLAGQKLQLMQQVAALTEQGRVVEMKLEGALDQVAEMRRQKTEMLAHQENLSKDLREHLLTEAKRADTAEVALAEAKLVVAAAREAEAGAIKEMERALAEAQATQAALQEKAQQVDTLRGLYLELREALERLAGDVTSGQQEAARRLLDATREHFLDQRALLEDVKSTTLDTHRAAQHSTGKVVELAAEQRVLVTEVVRSGQAAVATLGAYERQLGITQQLLQQSEVDRVQLARQAIAASALNRIESKRHEKTVSLLLHEVPQSVAQRIAPGLQALAEGTQALAEELEATNNTLAEAGVAVGGGRRAQDMLHEPMVPDTVDDATTQLLANSRNLRAQLINLAPDGPAPAQPSTDDDGTFGGRWAAARAGEQELQLPGGAFPGAFWGGDGGWAPAGELMAATPFPAPQVEPQSAFVGPPGVWEHAGYVPGAGEVAWMPPDPAQAYAAPMHPGAGYALPVPLGPPARLDLVLQLEPEEPSQRTQPVPGVAPWAPLPPPQPQPQFQFQPPTDWQVANGANWASAGQQADASASGQQPVSGAYSSDPDAASVWVPAAHEVGAAVQPGTGYAPAGGAGGGPAEQQADMATHRWAEPSLRAQTEGDRVAVAAADAQAGGAKLEGSVAGEAPPAHVWVPSPALLEAFKDVQL
ncbi:hypothetical protein PLESTF_001099600 [Pleodorina starrii]|nr:hypothetical protein PLESTF_001099600 [Pleodorina starrii]